MNLSILGRVEQANGRLKSSNAGILIELAGNSLRLRGVLPPKPNSTKKTPYQQRISLNYLGIKANPAGIKESEAQARKISALITCREFDWTPYLKATEVSVCHTVNDWVSKFEVDYFAKRSRTPQSETTWKGDYLRVFSKLPQNEPLTVEALTRVIHNTEPDTRTRKRAVIALNAIAKFASLEVNFKPYSGTYSPSKVQPRNLPNDLTIATWFTKITALDWQWAYGILATYGLRNHELFYIDFTDFPMLRVTDGKTGSRLVYPLYPEWAEEWELNIIKIPKCSGKTNSDLGSRVQHAFKRLEIPFAPYNLRHAWAVRSLEYGLDISLAAKQMGHSVQVHSDQYHHWIGKDVHKKAFNALANRLDRPYPPQLSQPPYN
ncbi:integrase [Chlorogloea sp. CCALA 695]|uniref:integrase n=1 Tax=Chlorogloea sp. CCALA 695 TaxID=2107693 RepID=UPI000D073331|nr:integrase [Chlorogloea sp. CCALA 695]PSB32264.1 integrase [Chlorogloea sp. CCALA 695]